MNAVMSEPGALWSVSLWGLLCAAAATLWWPKVRTASVALLALALIAAFAHGVLGAPALVSLALLALAAWLVRPARPRAARIGGHVLFVLTAFALGLHLLPGFNNPQLLADLRLSADSAPMSLYFNFDKPLAGFWLLLCWPLLRLYAAGDRPRATSLGAGLAGAAIAALLCLGLGLALNVVAWAPKWPWFGALWALNNLLLVALTEEAMFRGYLQESLQRRWERRRYGAHAAIAVSALAFGLVHAGGGARWVALATLAGLAYGWAYRKGGLAAAVLAHFGLNLLHFTLFTYPQLA
ncbi:CPBP family intramembrane metalloprotease [Lysobacter sp. K5869]|uniref:CPBP family intramembrane glutamic endopeptidase n=1 Tax=Lysobacter sp. K5869 TaxID=2820808 RepID=UPI001C064534|nr:CPBP family intramembrane glutamic endopeptidase [Lysobacter sp. K5869]QWP78563.1 CPBP family intramembrane metalloprotease [Lysobacter sp. K5869]